MFRWRMEMELMREEVSLWDVLIEQADGLCAHVIKCSLLIAVSFDIF